MTSYRELIAKGGDKAVKEYSEQSIKFHEQIRNDFKSVSAEFANWLIGDGNTKVTTRNPFVMEY